jgi:hypothetical protein
MNLTVLLGGLAMLLFWGVWGIVVKVVTKEIGMQALIWGQLGAIGLFPDSVDHETHINSR